MIPFASDEAIKSLVEQLSICGDRFWPQIAPEHGREIIKELEYWRLGYRLRELKEILEAGDDRNDDSL